MPPKGFTSISVKDSTKKRLQEIMKYGDSFDSKINDLIDFFKKKH